MKNRKSLKVLICGDDALVGREIQNRAAELGHTTVTGGVGADDIGDAVSVARPDLVFVTSASPCGHGLQIIREIQRVFPVPLILLVEQDSPALLQEAGSAGANWVLQVPADSTAIACAIDIALVRHRDLLELRNLRERMKMTVREFVHRIKNDLSVITSLLHFQADSCGNPETATAILESADRVRVISALYDIIRSSEYRDFLRLDHYLELLLSKVGQGLSDERGIALEVATECVVLDGARALNCGLIVRELVANAIKHAFLAQGEDRRILVTVHLDPVDDTVDLSVHDNGTGLAADIDPALATTFGFQLVSFLVCQLKGTLAVGRTEGTMLRIRFKVPQVNTVDSEG